MMTNDLNDLNLSQQQLKSVKALKHWVQTEAEFYGRSDEESLILFLNACDYDVELTKSTLTKYYKCRRDIPQWWTDRTINNEIVHRILKQRVATALINSRTEQPAVAIVSLGRLDPTISIDDFFKAANAAFQIGFLIRWKNVIKSGGIVIFDWRDYNWNCLIRFFSPTTISRMAYNFYNCIPVKSKKYIVLNGPYIFKKMAPFISTFFPPEARDKVVVYGSDLSTLSDHVPSDMLPEEYGGQGGPLRFHEDAFESDILPYKDYLLDDDKYGYTLHKSDSIDPETAA